MECWPFSSGGWAFPAAGENRRPLHERHSHADRRARPGDRAPTRRARLESRSRRFGSTWRMARRVLFALLACMRSRRGRPHRVVMTISAFTLTMLTRDTRPGRNRAILRHRPVSAFMGGLTWCAAGTLLVFELGRPRWIQSTTPWTLIVPWARHAAVLFLLGGCELAAGRRVRPGNRSRGALRPPAAGWSVRWSRSHSWARSPGRWRRSRH